MNNRGELLENRPDPKDPLRPLRDRVYGITGAANGIGAAIAEVLAENGASLVLADLDLGKLEAVGEELRTAHGVQVSTVCGDVSDPAVNAKIASVAMTAHGQLDGAVINAGIATTGSLTELSSEAWNRCMDVNLFSAFSLTQEVMRSLISQGRGGSIVFIASKNAFGPGKGFGAYSVSKAAMVQLARIAAIEGGEHGIRSNVVNPDSVFEGSLLWSQKIRQQRAAAHGVAESDLEQHYAKRNLLQATISGRDVGESVAFLLSDSARRTTGCVITVDGGVSSAFPR